MNDGDYIVYTLECRLTHETPWCKPNAPLKPTPTAPWHLVSFDHFDAIIHPWSGQGSKAQQVYKKSFDDSCRVRSRTGYDGWSSLSFAMQALQRLEDANEHGKICIRNRLDRSIDVHQRYDFRIISIYLKKTTNILDRHTIDCIRGMYENS